MSSVEEEEIRALQHAVSVHLEERALTIVPKCAEAVTETLLWLRHFDLTRDTDVARELLAGCHAAIIETVALVSLGLGRPALGAMRQQSELLLSYLYFRTHPDEWERVTATGNGFMLQGAVVQFQKEMDGDLQSRLALLPKDDEASLSDVYRLLSAHVHGQSPLTAPATEHLAGVSVEPGTLDEIVELQERVSRALSNYLVALYAPHWPDIPPVPVRRVSSALTPTQRAKFFGGTA